MLCVWNSHFFVNEIFERTFIYTQDGSWISPKFCQKKHKEIFHESFTKIEQKKLLTDDVTLERILSCIQEITEVYKHLHNPIVRALQKSNKKEKTFNWWRNTWTIPCTYSSDIWVCLFFTRFEKI